MINENKIKYMTKAAIFDAKEEKGDLHINHYYKSDYISYHMIRVFLGITVCYALLILMWAMLGMESLLETSDIETLIPLAVKAVMAYVMLLTVYLGLTIVIYRMRYEASRKNVREYVSNLKRLNQYYQPEGKMKETTAEDTDV